MSFQLSQVATDLGITNRNRCTGPFCTNGNCPGCKDGNKWCYDPRCAPFCPRCYISEDKPTDHAVGVALISILAVGIALILFILYGPIDYEDIISII